MELGALFVVIVLMIMMLVLCVLNWDTLDMVSLILPSTMKFHLVQYRLPFIIHLISCAFSA